MRLLFLFFFLMINFNIGITQEEVIKITSERKDNIVFIYAENTADEIYNVELNITSTGFKHTKACPIHESIKPGQKVKMTSLIAKKNEEASYSFGLKYSPSHKRGQQQVVAGEISDIDVTDGVFVFSKNGCSRCVSVEKFLTEHHIAYTQLNISKSPNDASLMWHKLAETGYTGRTVQTPVIIVNGEIHFNKANYNTLLQSLIDQKGNN